ncbi:tRNA 2-thiouridine(34) synthase MnmA [Candidatus Parcubacteria bacterium]|nr:tRNA 2-thiouridine(34) synthase MnmA [Candidatus Parcubacteria bacterium]
MKITNKKTVVVAMSGGVDSSVAAYLLKQAGYTVMGVFLRLHDNYEEAERAARAVCKKLEIKFYPLSAKESFEKEVVEYFIKSYANGITPNPCVVCNKAIKFGVLLKMMKELQGDYLASGHYIRLRRKGTGNKEQGTNIKLIKGIDKEKDQSYFLYTLGQEQLRHLLFPLGKYTKTEIKKIAKQADLPVLKTESQDVCFLVNEGKIIEHNIFLRERLKMTVGDIKDLNGKKLGEHKGLPLYTIGQRRGVEIGGTGPYYVARCDYKTNTLYVVNDPNDPALFSDEFVVKNVNWISGKEPKMPYNTEVVIRYRHKAIKCKVCKTLSVLQALVSEKQEYAVKLKTPARAVTPGQSAVFYDNNEVIGGGIIQ